MRKRIVLGYFQVNEAIVWDSCQTDLTSIIESLKSILESLP